MLQRSCSNLAATSSPQGPSPRLFAPRALANLPTSRRRGSYENSRAGKERAAPHRCLRGAGAPQHLLVAGERRRELREGAGANAGQSVLTNLRLPRLPTSRCATRASGPSSACPMGPAKRSRRRTMCGLKIPSLSHLLLTYVDAWNCRASSHELNKGGPNRDQFATQLPT